MSLKNEVLRGLKWTAGAKFSGQLITWAITIFVMRLLAPSDYGLLAMASVLMALLGMFAEAGLGPALIQQAEVSQQKLRQAFGMILLVNLVLFGFLNLLAPLAAQFYSEARLVDIVRVLSIQFLLGPLCVIPDVLLQRKLEFKTRSLIEFGAAVLTSVATLLMALAGFGIWSLVLGNLAGISMRMVALNVAAPFFVFPSFSASGMRQVLAFGGQVTASRFLWFFYTQADTVIVGRLLGEHILGMYSVAMHLATLPVQRVSAILNSVVFPAVSRFQHEKELIASQLLKAFKLIGFIAFPVLWGMSSVAPELIAVLLGPGWSEAGLPFLVLTLVMPFRALAGFLPTVTDAVGRPDVGLRNVILGCLIMPLAFFAGAHWGMVGVSLAWVCVYPFVLFINMKRMLAVVGLSVSTVLRQLALPIGCAAGMYASVWIVRMLFKKSHGDAVLLAGEIAAGAMAYVLFTLMVNRTMLGEIKLILRPSRG
jgi:O-antigen/teichoic acid export membrane protein